MSRAHSIPWKIFPNSMGQFASFHDKIVQFPWLTVTFHL